MARLLHLSKAKVQKEPGKDKIKRAQFDGFPDVVRMGVHGGIADYFKVKPEHPMPSTLDYVVAAIGGCMTGTVAGALEARGIDATPEKLQVDVEGRIEEVDGKMLLTSVSLRYKLKVPKDKRAAVERALQHHEALCAVSESVRRGIAVDWQADIEEESASESKAEVPASSAV